MVWHGLVWVGNGLAMGWQWVGVTSMQGLQAHPCSYCPTSIRCRGRHRLTVQCGQHGQRDKTEWRRAVKRVGWQNAAAFPSPWVLGINRMGKLQGLWNKSIGLNLIGNIHPSPRPISCHTSYLQASQASKLNRERRFFSKTQNHLPYVPLYC